MPRSPHVRPLAVALLLALAATFASAQERFEDPNGRFVTPVPSGWSVSATSDVVTFQHDEPPAVMHVLAPIGAEEQEIAAALAILVDAELDAAFAAAPLQAVPVPLPSGLWTQRIYQVGEEIVALISLERAGYTFVVLAQATQAAFMQAANAAANEVLAGFEVLIDEPAAEDPTDLPYDVFQTTFASGALTLAGTLTLPEGDGPHPGLVVVSGSGAQDRDGVNPALPGYASLRWLADGLTRSGFAVLRFDERGIGASEGDHEAATTADLAEDVAAGLRHVADHDRVDRERVGLLGHSEGSVIVGRVAARLGDEVAFLVSLAGPGLPYTDVVVVQVERILTAAGASPEEIAAAVAQQRQVLELALAGDWEALEVFLIETIRAQLEALPEEQRAQLGDTEALVAQQAAAAAGNLRSPWLSYFLDYDPRNDLRHVRVPVLALFAELDVQVDAEQNLAPFVAALAEAGNDDVTARVFPRANHLFQEAVTGGPEEYLRLEMAFVPGLLETIAGWLRERFLP
jgi:pimeloyl-ACP methyl ester carboxylesterase